jgi:predicted acylesterase/phospholipase RssA
MQHARNGARRCTRVAIASHAQRMDASPASTSSRPAATRVKHINLALQGGGAHGAFTWGVLDRLLEDPRIVVEGVSATSSGAMNAVIMAYGLTIGGREGAREALGNFWRRVAQRAGVQPLALEVDHLANGIHPRLSSAARTACPCGHHVLGSGVRHSGP